MTTMRKRSRSQHRLDRKCDHISYNLNDIVLGTKKNGLMIKPKQTIILAGFKPATNYKQSGKLCFITIKFYLITTMFYYN